MNMEELPPSTLRQRRHPRDHDNNPENSDDENAFPAPLHDTISYPLYLDPSTAKYHIFFIPGNPGLISYYDTFLSLISAHLNSNEQQQKTTLSHPFSVYGRSLGGFEVSDTSNNDIKEDSSSNSNMMVYSLQEQIDFMARYIGEYFSSFLSPGSPSDTELPKVILVGHSVGAFIALEILRTWMGTRKYSSSNSSSSSEDDDNLLRQSCQIIGFVGLMPTVIDIAKSKNGVAFTKLLTLNNHLHTILPFPTKTTTATPTTPSTPLLTLAALSASILSRLLPHPWLLALVKRITGFPDAAARTTVAFLESGRGRGVRQALYMARDEMEQITHEHWTICLPLPPLPSPSPPSPTQPPTIPMSFLFTPHDPWIPSPIPPLDVIEDAIYGLKNRNIDDNGEMMDGEKVKKAKVVVLDEGGGVKHSFCVGMEGCEIVVGVLGGLVEGMVEEGGWGGE